MPLPGPDTRVVELRVAGLVGTTGESLLDTVNTVDVAGDGVGRIVRPCDRLRRPAPGPVLKAIGRSIPRTLEGYLWTGMTSGGASKALWALLFPFSLANVAHWMLPPTRAGNHATTLLAAACRALLRLASLLLTMLLISQLAVVVMDLVAAQCLAPGSGCLASVPTWIRELGWVRTALGVLPLLLVILVLHRVSASNWPVNAADTASAAEAGTPGESLRADPATPALRFLHSVAALAAVALLPLGGPFRLPAGGLDRLDTVTWAIALVVLAGVLLTCAVLDTHRRAGRWVVRLLGPWPRRVVLTVATVLVLVISVHRTPLPPAMSGSGLVGSGPLAGVDGTVDTIGAALLVVCVLFGALLIPAALLARPAWRALPRRLRPWAGGWAAAPVLALACLLGGGFGAGLAFAARELIGARELRLPASYTLVTMLWGAGLVLAVLLGLLSVAVAIPRRRRARGIPDIVKLLQPNAEDWPAAAAAWARASWERRHLHRIVLTVALALSAGIVALLAVQLSLDRLPSWLNTLAGLGVLTLGGLAAGLLRVIYTAARKPERHRHLGALADLVCFWPRAAHPTVPPCYALKVVPELVARTKEHLTDPHARVVLAGYSLGGMLGVVALARLSGELDEQDRARVGLLTAGAPLQWGYQRAFPAVLPHEGLTALHGDLGTRWRGLCRGTDIFGGGVTTWRHQVISESLLGVGYTTDGTVGPLPAAVATPNGALVLGSDHWLPDPMRDPGNGRRWAPGILGNADYLADPEWDNAVSTAAGLQRPDRGHGEQVPLFGELSGLTRR